MGSDVIDGTTTTKCYTTNADSADDEVSCEGSTLVDVETTGTYTIQYRSTNTVGLWNDGTNCRGGPIPYLRTVVVMDTLRPVISLKYKYSDSGSSSVLVARGSSGNHDGSFGYDRTAGVGLEGTEANVALSAGAVKGHTNDRVDNRQGAYPAGGMTDPYKSWTDEHG